MPPDRHPEPGVQVGEGSLTLGSSDARRSRSSGDVPSPCSVSIGSRKYKARQHRRPLHCRRLAIALQADRTVPWWALGSGRWCVSNIKPNGASPCDGGSGGMHRVAMASPSWKGVTTTVRPARGLGPADLASSAGAMYLLQSERLQKWVQRLAQVARLPANAPATPVHKDAE